MTQFLSGPNSARVRERLFKELDVINKAMPLRGLRAVDVGAGDLMTAIKLSSLYGLVVDAVDMELQPSSMVGTRRCDLNESWVLTSDTYDVAVSTSVIEHLENPYHFFRELYRVLKPGGIGIVSTHDFNHYWSKLHFLLTNQHKPFVWSSCNAVGDHRMALNKEWLCWIAAREGFVVEKVFYGNPAVKVLPFVPAFSLPFVWACQEVFIKVRRLS